MKGRSVVSVPVTVTSGCVSTVAVTESIFMSQIRLWVTYWLCNLCFAGLLALALTEFCG